MVPSVDTATAVPERSHEQRLRALRRANEIRSKRAQLKRDLKAGKTKIEALLLDPPDYVMSAKAFDMILAVPKYGRVKANKILTQCRISPSKTIGGLSSASAASSSASCVCKRRYENGGTEAELPGAPGLIRERWCDPALWAPLCTIVAAARPTCPDSTGRPGPSGGSRI